MRRRVLIDTGPIVAILNDRDRHHQWVKRQISELSPPLLTCEAVVTEACFLADKYGNRSDAVLELVESGFMTITPALRNEISTLRTLLRKYADVPMSFADAYAGRIS